MGLKIKVHYTFYIFLFFVIYFCNFFTFFNYFIALFIHELSHHLLSRSKGKLSETITIYPFGFMLGVKNNTESDLKKFLIYFIGPFVNILIGLICIAIWWYFPVSFYYLKDFVFVNFMLGFFNLIPIQPLDGGNIFLLFFKNRKVKEKVSKGMKKVAIILSAVFLILFVISIFYSINFSCFCISFFLFSAGLSNPITYDDITKFLPTDVKECRVYAVSSKTKIDDLKKLFDPTKFVQFYILNDKNKIIKILSQEDVSKLL